MKTKLILLSLIAATAAFAGTPSFTGVTITGTTGNVPTNSGTNTLTNKTLASPVLSGTQTGTVVDATTRTFTASISASGTAATLLLPSTAPASPAQGNVIVSGSDARIWLTGSTGLIIKSGTVTVFP